MAVLVYLAGAGGAVVSRNEILDAVWPRLAVTPDALSRCLVELRKAFDDDSNELRTIETIPKVGIRLTRPVARIETEPAVELTQPAPRLAVARRKGARYLVGTLLGVGVLAAGIFGWTHRPAADTAPTANPQALNFYLSANEYAKRTNRLEALKNQEALYRRAVEADPKFAQAWARLGRTDTSLYWYGLDRSPQRLALAQHAFSEALRLNPALPEAHLYLAEYDFKGRGDTAAALTEFAIAERSMSRSAELHFLRASVYRRTGQWPLAVRDGELAIGLDPRNIVYRRQQHVTYEFMRSYASAARVLDDILDLWPDDGTTYVDKAVLMLCSSGDTDLADQYDRVAPSAQYPHGLAYVYTRWLAALFDRDYARAIAVLDGAGEGPIFNGDLRTSTIPKAALYARTHLLAGQTEQGRLEFATLARATEQSLDEHPSEDPIETSAAYLTLAEARVESGEREAGLESMHHAENLLPKTADALSGSATQLAAVIRVLVPAHEIDQALRELDDYLSAPGHWAIEGLARDPRLAELRGDPRFAALIEKYKRR
jgi:cytochrome c-type biogenesis protein CcmH/NrfG